MTSSFEMGRVHNIKMADEPSVPIQQTSTDVHTANYRCPRCSQPMTGLGLYCPACLDPDAEISRLRTELEREQRARGLEQLDMVRLESEVERLQRLIGEAYAKRGPGSSQVLRSLFGQATRGTQSAARGE